MTERKHLKQLVRTRMSKTGESYTTARRHLTESRASEPARSAGPFPGTIPIATAFRALLAHAGVRHPDTGLPLSEAMVFGLGGGIGAGVYAFHYAKEDFSSFYIAGRHLWQDDLSWAKELAKRLGLKTVVRESTGARAGEKHLRELLGDGRPVLAWVDAGSLPHRAMPASWQGGGYHVVSIHGIDDAAGLASMGDLSETPVSISLADLAVARGRIKKFKNRLLALEPATKAPDLAKAVQAGIEACVESLTTCKMKNFRLDAFGNWAEKLDGGKGAESWEKMFRPGHLMYQGLWSITEFVDFYGGGGLCRPIFAEFLAEAGRVLRNQRLASLAERYAALGRDWSALADAALPDSVPMLRETKRLFHRRARARTKGNAGTTEVAECWQAIEEQGRRVRAAFPLDEAASTALRRNLKARVAALYEGEVRALRELAGI